MPMLLIALVVAIGVTVGVEWVGPPPVRAMDVSTGPIKGRIDTTVSTGISIRVEERDPTLVGQTNGGEAFSAGYDDGNLNFSQWNVTSLNFKVLHEADLGWRNYGFFGRFYYFYDWAIMKFDPNFRAFTDQARRRAGMNIILLDLYITADYEVFGRPFSVRVGNQVLNWGESTFIQGGINSINPVDVTLLRVAGAELKEALIPIPMISINAGITDSLSIEAFYQFYWENTEIEPFGTYFSTTDVGSPGASRAMLGYGLAPPDGPSDNPVQPVGSLPPGGSWIPRGDDIEARHMGQFGIALRYFATWLNDTEFGLYWEHLHSRRPVISGTTGDPPPEALIGQVIWGLVNGDYGSTGRYFREFPEDIDILGMSWNTEIPFGVAFQGEVSGRLDQPIQIDDVEQVSYSASPLDPTLAPLLTLQNILEGIPPDEAEVTPPIFGNSQLYALRGPIGFNEYMQGWERKDMLQAQATFTKLFGPTLGADGIAFLCEAGATWFFGMEGKDVLRYDGPGTDTSGDPWFTEAGLQPATTEWGGFADPFSWGYRLATILTFNNAIGVITLQPIFAWFHDVEGITPSPISNFVAGRKVMTLALAGAYLKKITGTLSYTMYFGGGHSNLLHDRDFLSFSANYSF
jgi:hypothetical protein